MRARSLLALAGFLFAAMTLLAEAAWKSYVSQSMGFSFQAPGELKVEKGVYRAAVAGAVDAVIDRFTENNIEYRVSVIDFTQRAAEGSVLMEEAAFIMQDGKEVLLNDFGRVDTGRDAVYGRRMTIVMPDNGGRKSAATYFTKGRLFALEATVFPANGDYGTPDAGRFVDSLVFLLSRTEPGAIELPLPR